MIDFTLPSTVDDTNVITIGLLLEPDQEMAAVSLSKRVCATQECSFLLDPIHNPPRVRLYEAIFPTSEQTHVIDTLSVLASNMIPFSMEWGISEITTHFIGQWGEINQPLHLFHDAILEAISPLRHGFFKQKYLQDMAGLTYDEKASLDRWGSPWAEPYRPHMILAKSTTVFQETPRDYDWMYKRCTFPGLIVGTRSGKKLETVHRFSFQNPTIHQEGVSS